MKKLLPIILALFGTGIGAGAGMMFAPEPEPLDCAEPPCEEAEPMQSDAATEEVNEADYLRLQNQFVVPVVRDELVAALVVMSLSLEVTPNSEDAVYSREPKLRDALLRVLFDHAHIGGFNGDFTESSRLVALRVALLEAAQATLGDLVTDILITDIVRQEV
ncbi:MAG: flagellar basal body-associated FliL family protein [Pseudomonadota bacterium]